MTINDDLRTARKHGMFLWWLMIIFALLYVMFIIVSTTQQEEPSQTSVGCSGYICFSGGGEHVYTGNWYCSETPCENDEMGDRR